MLESELEAVSNLRLRRQAASLAAADLTEKAHVDANGLQTLAREIANELRSMYASGIVQKPWCETRRDGDCFQKHIELALDRLVEKTPQLRELASRWNFLREGCSEYHNPRCNGEATNPDFCGRRWETEAKYAVIEAKYGTLSHKPHADRYIGQQMRFLGAHDVECVMLISYAEPTTSEVLSRAIRGALGRVGPEIMRSVAVAVVYPCDNGEARGRPPPAVDAGQAENEGEGNSEREAEEEGEEGEGEEQDDDGGGTYLGQDDEEEEEEEEEASPGEHAGRAMHHAFHLDPDALRGDRRLWKLWLHLQAEGTILRKCLFDVPRYMRQLYDILWSGLPLSPDDLVPEMLAGGSTQMGKTVRPEQASCAAPKYEHTPAACTPPRPSPRNRHPLMPRPPHEHVLLLLLLLLLMMSIFLLLLLRLCASCADVCRDRRVRMQAAGRGERLHHLQGGRQPRPRREGACGL